MERKEQYMGLERISESVLAAAKTEAEHIVKAAQHAAEERVEAAREAAEREGERQYQAAVRAIEEEFARKLIQCRGVAGKELLIRKNACLRGVFDCAKAALKALPETAYMEVMGRLLERAAGADGGTLRVHAEDRARFLRFLEAFNRNRAVEAQVRLEDAAPLPERGGFLFSSGRYEVDQTLDTLLKDMERELAPQIAAELFGGIHA